MATSPAAPPRTTRRISRTGLAVFVIAAVAVAVATVVGVRGLLASPVVSVARDGSTTLRGTWEPYSCAASPCEGYVQAGGRSVFVVLPRACSAPARAAEVTVTARQDRALGNGAYLAAGCPR